MNHQLEVAVCEAEVDITSATQVLTMAESSKTFVE